MNGVCLYKISDFLLIGIYLILSPDAQFDASLSPERLGYFWILSLTLSLLGEQVMHDEDVAALVLEEHDESQR